MNNETSGIYQFTGKYRFLSNYYPCRIVFNGIEYLNTEAAFHAQKDLSRSREFSYLNPGEAKRLGRRVQLREEWEQVKDDLMFQIVQEKFKQNPRLAMKLIDTGDRELVEGNDWGDQYWGVTKFGGENHLGKILMKIRDLYHTGSLKV